jgi:hypothetical protein
MRIYGEVVGAGEPAGDPSRLYQMLTAPLPGREQGIEPGQITPMEFMGEPERAPAEIGAVVGPRTVGELIEWSAVPFTFAGRHASQGIIKALSDTALPSSVIGGMASVAENAVREGLMWPLFTPIRSIRAAGRVGGAAAEAAVRAAPKAVSTRLTGKIFEKAIGNVVKRDPDFITRLSSAGITREHMTDAFQGMVQRKGPAIQEEFLRLAEQRMPRTQFEELRRWQMQEWGAGRVMAADESLAAQAVRAAPEGAPARAPTEVEVAGRQMAEFGPPPVAAAARAAVTEPLEVAASKPAVARPVANVAHDAPLPSPTAPAQVADVAGEGEQAFAAVTRDMPLSDDVKAIGDAFRVTMPESSSNVVGRYLLAELDDVTHSYKPGYREALQPRDRTRLASEIDLLKKEGTFDPPRLGASPTTDMGSPVVTNDLQVMVGNGRVELLGRIYRGADPTKRTTYREWLSEKAPTFGFTREQVANLERPVLVRNVDDFDPGIGLRQFVDENNIPQKLGAGIGEQAVSDAKLIRKHIGLYQPGIPLAHPDNRAFQNAILKEAVSPEAMLTARGLNTVEFSRRMRQGFLAEMIGEKHLGVIQTLAETAGEEGLGRVANALIRTAPNLGRLTGTPLSLSDDVSRTIDDLLTMSRDNLSLEDLLGQGELFTVAPRSQLQVEMLNLFTEARSSKKIAAALDGYVEEAAKIDVTTGDLFGGTTDQAIMLKKAMQRADVRIAEEAVEVSQKAFIRAKLNLENLRTARAAPQLIAEAEAKVTVAEASLVKAERIATINDEAIGRHAAQEGVAQRDRIILDFGVAGGEVEKSLGAAAARDFPVDPIISSMADDMVLRVRQMSEYGAGAFEKSANLMESSAAHIAGNEQMLRRVVSEMSAGTIAPRIREGIEYIGNNMEKIGKAGPLSWSRPPNIVLHELGLGAIDEMFQVSKEALLSEMNKVEQQIITIYKKAGIKKHNDRSRSVFRILDGTADEGDMMMAGREGVAAAKELRVVLDDLGRRFGIPPERRIRDYITHIFDRGNPELVEPELFSAMKFTGKIENPYLNKRLGATDYLEDVVGALDAYVRAGMKNLYLHQPVKELQSILSKAGKAGHKMPANTRDFLEDYLFYMTGARHTMESRVGLLMQGMAAMGSSLAKAVPMSKGMRARLDRFTKEIMNAPAHISYRRGVDWVRGNMFIGALGLAADSALTNLTQGVNTFAEFGSKVFLRGYREMAAGKLGNKKVVALLKESGILEESHWHRLIEGTPLQIRQAVGDRFMVLFQQAEQINRSSAFLGVYRGAMEGTLKPQVARNLGIEAGVRASHGQALAAGKKAAAITQFNYMSTGTPLMFQHPMGKLFGQLGSFPLRQIEFLSPLQAAKRLKEGDLLHHDLQRMYRYVLASALVTTGGENLGLSVRDNLWPLVPDGTKPLKFSPGFMKFGPGPIPGFIGALGAVSRGQADAVRDLKRTGVMFFPGGRAISRAAREYGRGRGLAAMAGLSKPEPGRIRPLGTRIPGI